MKNNFKNMLSENSRVEQNTFYSAMLKYRRHISSLKKVDKNQVKKFRNLLDDAMKIADTLETEAEKK